MIKTFRTEEIKIDNEVIDLEFRPVEDIFKPNEAPYLAVGMTEGGKTTMCIDIIHKYAKSYARIYYMTSTEAEAGDTTIQSIPNVFRIKPSFENLYAVWREIKEGAERMKMTIEQMMTLLPLIYPASEMAKINKSYQEQMRNIDRKLTEKNKNLDTQTLRKKIASEKDIVAYEVLTRLILSGINIYGYGKLNKKQENMIKVLMSTEQNTILLIDDVTAELVRMKKSKRPVRYGQTEAEETDMKEGEAMTQLLTDIFTKARHYNVLLVLFVHTWGTIDLKQQLKNFIIIDEKSAEEVRKLPSVSTKKTKELIKIATNKIFPKKYPFHVVVVKDSEVFITKADLNTGNALKLDRLNQHFVDLYDKITIGMDYIPNSNSKDISKNNYNDDVIDDIDEINNLID